AGTAPAGSQLPGTADLSISNRLSYNFGGAHAPTLSVSHQYLSGGISDLNSAVPGATASRQGNYNLFDARLRLSFDNTTLSRFASNPTDKRGVTRTVGEANGVGEGLVRPRTFGITAHWQY